MSDMRDHGTLKQKITAGQPVLGTWNMLGGLQVTEVLARSGLDFVIVDFEHGPFLIESVHALVNACQPYGCSPIVRLPANEDWLVLHALDQGAHGVMVPHVDTAEQARRVCASAKYRPQGQRGYSPFTKSGGFTNRNQSDYAARANKATITAVLVESAEGLKGLEAILETADVDVVYFGAYDLSQALGCTGGVKDRTLLRTIESAARQVSDAGKCPGGFVPQSWEEVRRLLDMGLRFITCGVDCAFLFDPLHAVARQFQAHRKTGRKRSRAQARRNSRT